MKKDREITSTEDYLRVFRENIDVFRWVWNVIIPSESKRYALKMIPFLIGSTLIAGIVPLLIGIMIDSLPSDGSKGDSTILIMAISGYALTVILQKVCDYIRQVYREWQLGYNQGSIDDLITKRFFEKSIGQHTRERSHMNVANLEKGRGRLLHVQFLLLFELGSTLFTLATSFVLLFFVSPIAGLVIMAALIPYLYMTFRMSVRVAIECDPIDHDFRALYRRRVSRWNQTPRVQVAVMEDTEVKEMREVFDEVVERDRTFWISFIKNSTIRELIIALGAFIAVTYSIWQVFNGNFTVGMVYPIFLWTNRVAENIWRVGNIERELNYHLPVLKSFREVMDLEPDVTNKPDAIKIGDEPIRIEFDGITHRHAEPVLAESSGENTVALRNVSFSIEPGEKVALIGASGCGKSTLTQLILRASDPEHGRVLVNGYDLRDIDLHRWREILGHIPQRPSIFDGTIRENLTYGLNREVSEDELRFVIDRLRIDFGDRMTNGWDTKVGWDGVELSGGEQQRLAAGAAVIKRPRFMIIDEATASLDSTTERHFQQGLEEIISDDTSAVIIAHRLSTIRNCDRFVVFQPADDVVDGSPQIEAIATSFDELYRVSPTFKQLADDQALRL